MSKPSIPLTSLQLELLVRLGEGPVRDCVGLELAQLSEVEADTVGSLVSLGLAEVDLGWRLTVWYTLSPAGWRRREAIARRNRPRGQGFYGCG